MKKKNGISDLKPGGPLKNVKTPSVSYSGLDLSKEAKKCNENLP
jgi:hypothetical protein